MIRYRLDNGWLDRPNNLAKIVSSDTKSEKNLFVIYLT